MGIGLGYPSRRGKQGKNMEASIRGALVGAALALACTTTVASDGLQQVLPPIPARPVDQQFKDAPAPWRDHLIAVRAVQQIEDPLARCLAWPDLPGVTWPEGHAEAHCRYHFTPVPSPADVDAHVAAGRVVELEELLAKRFEGHDRAQHPDESVHVFFAGFETLGRTGDGMEADRISQRWLELSPDSAFALLARATVLEARGWQARGRRWARETTREQFAAMDALFAQALPLYHRAIEQSPRLTDAYIGLVSIAKSGRGMGNEARIVDQARRVAPGCAELALDFMRALEPKWGGSYEAMLAYASVLEPEVAASPLIANQLAAPYVVVIDSAHRAEQYTAEAASAIDDVLAISSNEEMLSLAAAANFKRSDGSAIDYTKAVVYLLQRQRFNTLSPWQARKLSWYFLRQEPEWALALMTDAVERDPDSGHGHYYLGAASYNTRRFEQAERHYLVASADPDVAQAALRELVGMWLLDAGLSPEESVRKAGPHLDELLLRYPGDSRARMFDIVRDSMLGGVVSEARMEAYLAIADRDDPVQRKMIEAFSKALGR